MVRTGLIIGLATTVGLVTVGRLAGIAIGEGPAIAPPAVRIAVPAPPSPVIAAVDTAPLAPAPSAKAASTSKGAAVVKTFKVNDAEQVFTVKGQGFEKGLTATLVAPLGLTTTFPAAAIDGLNATSFSIRMMLDEPGTFLFSVRNQNGGRSAQHQIVVKR
jgi:hypothetical protein